jgi:hypothetical protein
MALQAFGFGLKGRFRQPRPKAWVGMRKNDLALKGPFTIRVR